MDLCARCISVGAIHKAYPMTISVATGAAACIEGTVAHELFGRTGSQVVRLGHASGVTAVDMKLDGDRVLKGGVTRTARRIMDGFIYIR